MAVPRLYCTEYLAINQSPILKSSCYRGSNLKPTDNEFESGFVRTVFVMGFGQADHAHEAWIMARSSGMIIAHSLAYTVKLIKKKKKECTMYMYMLKTISYM